MEVERVLRVDCEPRTLVAIDATKRHFVTSHEDGKVTRWSVARGNCEILRGHVRKALCMVFSPRSDLLCTGSYDHTLRLWNMDGCECIATLEGHEDEVTCVAFDPRGRMVCSGSADKSLKLWRVMDGFPFPPPRLNCCLHSTLIARGPLVATAILAERMQYHSLQIVSCFFVPRVSLY